MKKLLNTLYILTPESYLFCRNETIAVKVGGVEKNAIPAKDIEAIVCFGQTTVSTPPARVLRGKRNFRYLFIVPWSFLRAVLWSGQRQCAAAKKTV